MVGKEATNRGERIGYVVASVWHGVQGNSQSLLAVNTIRKSYLSVFSQGDYAREAVADNERKVCSSTMDPVRSRQTWLHS